MKKKSIVNRLDLLKAELDINRVHFGNNEFGWSDIFLNELLDALTIEKHENKTSSYGAFFTNNPDLSREAEIIPLEPTEIKLARSLADGIYSFALFQNQTLKGVVTFHSPLTNEASLIHKRETYNALILIREQSGTLKIFHDLGMTFHSHRVWKDKPRVEAVMNPITSCISQAEPSLLKSILEFSFYELSALNIGATIIWCLKQPSDFELEKMKPQQDLSHLDISLANKPLSTALRHILSKTDGATLVYPDGKVIGIEAHLKYSEDSIKFIPQIKGTRHTSAQRFSFDVAKVIAFVVSEDGPVTVFSDGINVATLSVSNFTADKEVTNIRGMLHRAMPELKDSVSGVSFKKTCSNCGKTSRIEEVVVPMFKEREEVYCPVCKNELYSSLCWRLDATLIKCLEHKDKSN